MNPQPAAPTGASPATADEPPELTRLLSTLDEFLRCGTGVFDQLVEFLAARGSTRPRYDACLLTDEVGFTAYGLRHPSSTDQDASLGVDGSEAA